MIILVKTANNWTRQQQNIEMSNQPLDKTRMDLVTRMDDKTIMKCI
jgi:hypothetical protein